MAFLRRLSEFGLLFAGFSLLTVILTYPLGFHPEGFARLDADGQFSIWNVSWVAHALLTNPTEVWNANIFHPNLGTLAYSEANLVAGLLATPVYALTRNPYAAHNSVLLLSFVLSALGMYYLVRYLVADRRAAVVSAICFAFCPYVIAHLSHIQLLMTAGLPFSLLAFHRLADRPTLGRGVTLGLVMAAQAYACGYYGIFAMLLVGFSTLVMATARRLWPNPSYWAAIAMAATVAVIAVLPLALSYASLTMATGFGRSLAEADHYSTRGRAYFASASYAHSWMLLLLREWREVLFPGFVAALFGFAGVKIGWSHGDPWRRRTWFYACVGVFAIWASLGPRAGLYRMLYWLVPGFTFLRAPSRFGLLLCLALSVLAGFAVAALLARTSRTLPWVLALMLAAIGESFTPGRFRAVPPVDPVYQALAELPHGAVIELPLYSNRFAFLRTKYMLASTAHWKPLVSGYSDFIPDEFVRTEPVLGDFPTRRALDVLRQSGVRYAVFHLNEYDLDERAKLFARLDHFSSELTPIAAGRHTRLVQLGQPAVSVSR